ncbi:hypothetical protein E5K00_21265 [Hymenobacter aquaticus]|uniref:Uncharacterized protein n=1 Tax=Hymenobacter aquaticus TaxID=1867101 RepID=A0A4Z0PT58_9BACT|nr:hypothetical protein [Hymenobacter aquaticus]TGE20526.1 hypothetical protein E5K00_21265 [Hymenobacter aquaticus]
MKTLSLLLLVSFLGVDAADAAPRHTATAAPATVAAATSHALGQEVTKRRKRKKSRPAYRRLGSPGQSRAVKA